MTKRWPASYRQLGRKRVKARAEKLTAFTEGKELRKRPLKGDGLTRTFNLPHHHRRPNHPRKWDKSWTLNVLPCPLGNPCKPESELSYYEIHYSYPNLVLTASRHQQYDPFFVGNFQT